MEHVDSEGVILAGERIASNTVIWTAGVNPSPAAEWLNVESDHAGRVRFCGSHRSRVSRIFSLSGIPQRLDQDGKALPGVAQVAMQQGRYAGRLIARRIAGKPSPRPFRYFDKGNMAVVGKNFAVLQSGKVHVSGFPGMDRLGGRASGIPGAIQPSGERFPAVGLDLLTGQRGSRLIVNYRGSESVSMEDAPDPVRMEK